MAAGGGWLGFQAAAGLRSRVRTLEEVQAGLALMEGELELNAPPLSELLARCAARSRGASEALFRGCLQGLNRLDEESFSSLWRRTVQACGALGAEGQTLLAPLGDTLGRYGTQRQLEALSAVGRQLEDLCLRLEADSRRQGRVYQALGLSGGAFLVILLL